MITNGNTLCDLFKNTSEIVWNSVGRNLRTNTNPSEIGITSNTLIPEIRDYILNNNSDKIWVDTSKNENLNGGDIDLYLQLKNGKYFRLLLQAKVLKINKQYDKVNYKSATSKKPQWELLQDVEKQKLAKTYYLFYSGGVETKIEKKDCLGICDKNQLGILLVEANIVMKIVNNNNNNKIGFQEIVKYAIPWRSLICCDNFESESKGFQTYTLDEINLDNDFKERYFKTKGDELGFLLPENEKVKEFNEFLEEKQIKPDHRVIINKYETGVTLSRLD